MERGGRCREGVGEMEGGGGGGRAWEQMTVFLGEALTWLSECIYYKCSVRSFALATSRSRDCISLLPLKTI